MLAVLLTRLHGDLATFPLRSHWEGPFHSFSPGIKYLLRSHPEVAGVLKVVAEIWLGFMVYNANDKLWEDSPEGIRGRFSVPGLLHPAISMIQYASCICCMVGRKSV